MGGVGATFDRWFGSRSGLADMADPGGPLPLIAEIIVVSNPIYAAVKIGEAAAKIVDTVNEYRKDPARNLMDPHRAVQFTSFIPLMMGPLGFFAANMLNRQRRDVFFENERRDLAAEIERMSTALSELQGQMMTGELRVLNARITATYAGGNVFIADDKPAEWRIYEELYRFRLLSSEEWRRQRAAASQRPFGMNQIADAFDRSARHFRSKY